MVVVVMVVVGFLNDFARLELAIETDPYDVAAWEARLREAIQAVTWGMSSMVRIFWDIFVLESGFWR